jgi:ribosomal protein S18 acetylase RimI-like enzyme
VELRVLQSGDEMLVLAASRLFDGPARLGVTRNFLSQSGHHLILAYVEGRPAGFVSGVEMIHPDKGTEMFLYELEVDARYREQGVGRALVDHLGALARQAGCYGMWTITDEDNRASRATYEGAGATPEPDQVVEVWTFA